MNEDSDELVGLFESVEAEITNAAGYIKLAEYTSARLCAEDACNWLADIIYIVKQLETA